MDTIASPSVDGRRRRRKHSAEFKAHVVAACCKPGVSMASVALANGVNANLVRRWVVESDTVIDKRTAPSPGTPSNPAPTLPSSFVPVPLPLPSASVAAALDIRIELQRASTKVVMTWPVTSASECAAWLRELLR